MVDPEETRKNKAKNLRYKKPIAKDLNLEAIKQDLWDMQEACEDVHWFTDSEDGNDSLVNALLGDEDESYVSYGCLVVNAWMPLPEPYRVSAENAQPEETPLTEQQQTNADRIRNMTDEELAEFLKEVKEDYQWANPDYPDCDDCGEWLEWLKSESEE